MLFEKVRETTLVYSENSVDTAAKGMYNFIKIRLQEEFAC